MKSTKVSSGRALAAISASVLPIRATVASSSVSVRVTTRPLKWGPPFFVRRLASARASSAANLSFGVTLR